MLQHSVLRGESESDGYVTWSERLELTRSGSDLMDLMVGTSKLEEIRFIEVQTTGASSCFFHQALALIFLDHVDKIKLIMIYRYIIKWQSLCSPPNIGGLLHLVGDPDSHLVYCSQDIWDTCRSAMAMAIPNETSSHLGAQIFPVRHGPHHARPQHAQTLSTMRHTWHPCVSTTQVQGSVLSFNRTMAAMSSEWRKSLALLEAGSSSIHPPWKWPRKYVDLQVTMVGFPTKHEFGGKDGKSKNTHSNPLMLDTPKDPRKVTMTDMKTTQNHSKTTSHEAGDRNPPMVWASGLRLGSPPPFGALPCRLQEMPSHQVAPCATTDGRFQGGADRGSGDGSHSPYGVTPVAPSKNAIAKLCLGSRTWIVFSGSLIRLTKDH